MHITVFEGSNLRNDSRVVEKFFHTTGMFYPGWTKLFIMNVTKTLLNEQYFNKKQGNPLVYRPIFMPSRFFK